MKGIAIYFLFLGSASLAPAPATGTGAGKNLFLNNSALGGHRVLPKVANERYCCISILKAPSSFVRLCIRDVFSKGQ